MGSPWMQKIQDGWNVAFHFGQESRQPTVVISVSHSLHLFQGGSDFLMQGRTSGISLALSNIHRNPNGIQNRPNNFAQIANRISIGLSLRLVRIFALLVRFRASAVSVSASASAESSQDGSKLRNALRCDKGWLPGLISWSRDTNHRMLIMESILRAYTAQIEIWAGQAFESNVPNFALASIAGDAQMQSRIHLNRFLLLLFVFLLLVQLFRLVTDRLDHVNS